MNKILSSFFGIIKYLLFVVSIGLVAFGIVKTYGRLDKPLTDSISVFVPFVFVLVLFFVNIFTRNKYTRDNLFFNFLAVLLFTAIIIICLRSMFDKNMVLFYRYNIDFNPEFFSNNLSLIQMGLYLLGAANLFLVICHFLDKKKDVKKNNVTKVNIELPSSSALEDDDEE